MQTCPSWEIKGDRTAESVESVRVFLRFLDNHPLHYIQNRQESQSIALKIALTDLARTGLTQNEIKTLIIFQKIHLSNESWFNVLKSAMQSREKENIIECFLFLFHTFSQKDCLISEYITNVPSIEIHQFILAVIKLIEEKVVVKRENQKIKLILKTYNDSYTEAIETLYKYLPLELELSGKNITQAGFQKLAEKIKQITTIPSDEVF